MSKSVVVVYNPKSGRAQSAAELRSLCERHDITITASYALSRSLAHDLRAHIKQGATIMAIGGDGTISAVARLLVDSQAVLLPLPGGTLNNFTKDLGIPQDLDRALAHAIASRPRSIDIASVNDVYFINNSSLGLYPQSLRTRQHLQSKLGKWPAAIVAVARALLRYRTHTVRVSKTTFQTPFIFVGNNSYHIEQPGLPSRERLDAGILAVSLAKNTTRFGLVKLFALSFFGKLHREDSFEHFTCNQLVISLRKSHRVRISRDGESAKLATPLTYKIHAKALRVLG